MKKVPWYLKLQTALFLVVLVIFTGWIGPFLSQQNDDICLALMVAGILGLVFWGYSTVKAFLEIFE